MLVAVNAIGVGVVSYTSPVEITLVKVPCAGVVPPIVQLFIVLAAVGLIVNAPTGDIATVPVPVGLIATAKLAGLNVTAPVAVNVVNAPVLAVPEPIEPGAANVAPFNDEAFKFATLVVDATVNGAVPVAIVDVIVVNLPVEAVVAPIVAPSIVPPLITGVANGVVPAPIVLMVDVSCVKFVSSCDNGIDPVAVANVFVIVIGRAIYCPL